jgi:hypothetical protein
MLEDKSEKKHYRFRVTHACIHYISSGKNTEHMYIMQDKCNLAYKLTVMYPRILTYFLFIFNKITEQET